MYVMSEVYDSLGLFSQAQTLLKRALDLQRKRARPGRSSDLGKPERDVLCFCPRKGNIRKPRNYSGRHSWHGRAFSALSIRTRLRRWRGLRRS